MQIRGALLDALALVSPVECAGCGALDRALCVPCLAALTPRVAEHRLPDGTPVWAALEYNGEVRRAILSFKENDRTDVATALARPLAAALDSALSRAASASRLELASPPPSRASLARRGYDPVTLLLRRAGQRASRVLVPARAGGAQKLLGVEARAVNRAGSMRAKSSLAGRAFLLVDDVLTSGATLGEAARAIRAAGGEVRAAAVLAFTPKLYGTAPEQMEFLSISRDIARTED